MTTDGSVRLENGIYLVADTPKSLTPLVTESGGGDKLLLVEALKESLSYEEQKNLRTYLPDTERGL